MRNPLIRLAVIAIAAIGLSACVAYPVGYRHHHHGYHGGGGYYRDYGPPRSYVYRDGYGYGRGRGGYYYR